MFIVNLGRQVTKYSGLLGWPLVLAGLVAVLLQPSLTGHQKSVLAFAYGLPLLAVGLVCLIWPHMVQRHLVESYSKHPHLAAWSFFKSFVRSLGYIHSLRFCGLAALAMVIMIVRALLR